MRDAMSTFEKDTLIQIHTWNIYFLVENKWNYAKHSFANTTQNTKDITGPRIHHKISYTHMTTNSRV